MSFITPLQIIAGAPGPAGPQGPEGPAGPGADLDVIAAKVPMSGIPVDDAGARFITLSYDEVARQVTITPTGATWDAFVDGVKYTFTGAQSIIHDAVHGGHFIYVDNTGTIVTSQVPWDLAETAPLVFVFWDNTNAAGIPFYEWHHAGRDVWLHTRLHAVDGTQTGPGFAISGYTLNDGSVDSALSFAIASGTIIDEDIFTVSGALADGGPYTILERSGASGNWLITRGNTLPVFHAANVLQYNQFTGATWQRTNVPEDMFVNYWVFATPALAGWDQFVVIPGQVTYATEVEAHGEVPGSLSWGSIPFQEIAPLYQVTLRYNAVAPSAYTNTPRSAIVRLVRVVGSRAILSTVAQSDHGALAGLLDDDHLQYHNDARGDARYLAIAAAAALLPVGGTAGQLLAKVDADDYDTTWIDPPAGGGDIEDWELVETITWGTAISSVDIALPFATYKRLKLVGDLGDWSSGAALVGLISIDGGSTFEITNYGHGFHAYKTSAVIQAQNSASATSLNFWVVPFPSTPNVAYVDLIFRRIFASLAAAGEEYSTEISGSTVARVNATGGNHERAVGLWKHRAGSSPTHLRLQWGAATVAAGNLKLLGVPA